MTENEAIELHIAENLHRIEVIEEFSRTNSNADDKECKKNIQILTKIDGALQEIKQYRAIGTIKECQEARKKQIKKKSVKNEYNHDCCPNCGWIVYQGEWSGRYLPHCENCGQAIDWSDVNNG